MLLSEPMIVARLAEATLGATSQVPWRWLVDDYDRIRELIAGTFDEFRDFNARVRVPGGFRLPNAAADRNWQTPRRRAIFKPHRIPTEHALQWARARSNVPVFNLTTVRSHDQYNTTIYALDDRYRGIHGERRVLFIHPDDIASLAMHGGDWVDLESLATDGIRRHARRFLLVAYDIPQGCLAAYYPETNALVPLSSFADEARTPTSKSIPDVVTPHEAGTHVAFRDIGARLVD
jgi:anaerobic selenocysteine-containing dehydrogenase